MHVSVATILLLTSTGFCAGFIDSIAGGGGLITVPVLLSIGMPPLAALGTNKFSATFGSFNATRVFIRKKIFRPRRWIPAIITTLLCAMLGVIGNHLLPTEFLKKLIPFLIIFVAIYVGFYKPDKNRSHQEFEQFEPKKLSSSLIGGSLGFYDGLIGPGTGSFWTCAVMAIYKIDLLSASGVARSMNFMSNVGALIAFICLGNVNYSIGLLMGVGLLCGSYLGAHSAIRFGANFIRPVFLTVVICLAIKLLIWH